MKILIKAGIAFTKDGPVNNVNIGMSDGKIEAISEKEIEDYYDAELSIGGENRLVSQGFVTTQTFLQLYPFRYRIFSGKANANDIVSTLSEKDVYYFSLLGAYHLLRSGITTSVITEPFVEHAARAMKLVGLKPIITAEVNCNWSKGDWKRNFQSLYSKWRSKDNSGIVLKLCDESEADEVFALSREYKIPVIVERTVNLSNIKEGDLSPYIIALGGGSRKDLEIIQKNSLRLSFTPSLEVCKFTLGSYKPSISLDLTPKFDIRNELSISTSRLLLTAEEAVKSVTEWGYSQLNLNSSLSVGNTADLVIFQADEPPSYPLDREMPFESLIFSSYNLETVIIDGEAVLDGGLPLNVGEKDISEANEKVKEFDERRKMEKN
ncbi:amidohydrolase [Acidianus sulfidivorans JP7]|uniref:amidohydrolase family protein n=1 Tax=Acidianus sulfidivorans TaxID=312539 RepID=UPI001442FD3B|nr:amidohydrolase [Acidianus sulfidivorans]AWR96610.2 amidohydrolase [Acidianus sulfidivorans JP7]